MKEPLIVYVLHPIEYLIEYGIDLVSPLLLRHPVVFEVDVDKL